MSARRVLRLRPLALAVLALAVGLAGFSSRAEAAQRALLVGIGKYRLPGVDLPGIELDLDRVRDTLKRMGFKDDEIRTLRDEQATSTNVITAFRTWLKDGVRPEDRVVFYYSGHGSNIPDVDGDESDHVDEVLVTHDAQRARVNGKPSLTGVVSDDEIGALIASNPSRNIWIIVDSCHSGTVTRSFKLRNRSLASDEVYVKSLTYPGMPTGGERAFSRGLSRAAPVNNSNYVSLTAAADGEEAIGTSRGGVFTIGLTEAITRLATQGRAVTVNALRAEAASYITSKVDKDQVHNPQVNGNPALADGQLRILAAGPASMPNRDKLLALAGAQSQHFEVLASHARYAIDDPVAFTLTLPRAGYLNVVTVDPQDNALVLFPNRHREDNAVTAGSFALPGAGMDFELLASDPAGQTLVVAFLSSDPINFYKETVDGRDANGNITVDFPSLSHSATRAIRIAPRSREILSGQVQIDVVSKGGTPPAK